MPQRSFGCLHQRGDFVDQLHFVGNQVRRLVVEPELFDLRQRQADLLRRLCCGVDAVPGLVYGVDDLHGIQRGNFLQVLQRDDPVEVDRLQSLDCGAHPVQPECADAHQAGQQGAGKQ